MGHFREAVAEEHVGGKAERGEDGGLLGSRLEHHDVAGAATDVDAGHIGGRAAELARRLVEVVGSHRLGHLDEVLVGSGNAEHFLERLRPHLAHLSDVAHFHGKGIEPDEACLGDVAVFEQHLGPHQLSKFGEISAHALRRGHLG